MTTRIPATLIIDDSSPINTMYEHGAKSPRYAGVKIIRDVPVAFLERFVRLTREVGLRGKFTLLPNPLGLGRLDQGIPGYPQAEFERFLEIVRTDIMPDWDITPEILTHWHALDLATGKFLDVREDVWAESQDADSLTAYFIYALQILKNIGIRANGITSPWSFAKGVEPAYAEAVGRSLAEVFNIKQAWYFLHQSDNLNDIWARVMIRRGGLGEGVVSVVSNVRDVFWDSQYRVDPASAREAVREHVEQALSPDGSRGRIADLIEAGQPVIMVTHWQSLFANGHAIGLEMLIDLVRRVNARFGDRLEWTTPSAIARRALTDRVDA